MQITHDRINISSDLFSVSLGVSLREGRAIQVSQEDSPH